MFIVERFEDDEGNIPEVNRLEDREFRSIRDIIKVLKPGEQVKAQKYNRAGSLNILVAQYMVSADGSYRKA